MLRKRSETTAQHIRRCAKTKTTNIITNTQKRKYKQKTYDNGKFCVFVIFSC